MLVPHTEGTRGAGDGIKRRDRKVDAFGTPL